MKLTKAQWLSALALCTTVCTTAACATISSPPPLPEGSMVALGQPVRAGNLVITPVGVTEDSRCPADVQCIWAGQLVLTAQIDGADWSERHSLTAGGSQTLHGTTVTFAEVQPAQRTTAEIKARDYRFRFDASDQATEAE